MVNICLNATVGLLYTAMIIRITILVETVQTNVLYVCVRVYYVNMLLGKSVHGQRPAYQTPCHGNT